jgi:hypothetical protein
MKILTFTYSISVKQLLFLNDTADDENRPCGNLDRQSGSNNGDTKWPEKENLT